MELLYIPQFKFGFPSDVMENAFGNVLERRLQRDMKSSFWLDWPFT